MTARRLLAVYLAATTAACFADPVDWVNVEYVLKHGSAATSDAQSTIVSKSAIVARNGPWTIATKGIKPPSGDTRDYLSWAPYHWPDCNWCSKGSTHFASPNGTVDDSDPEDDSGDDSDDPNEEVNSIEDLRSEKVNVNFFVDAQHVPRRMKRVHRSRFYRESPIVPRQNPVNPPAAPPAGGLPPLPVNPPTPPIGGLPSLPSPPVNPPAPPAGGLPSLPSLPAVPILPGLPQPPAITAMPPAAPTLAPPVPAIPGSSTSTSHRVVGTQAPAQAPAKTEKGKSQCTPSPTKSLAPSATWTTCPYVVRDGKVNPDTDTLVGPDAAQAMSQSVFYNAIAYALKKSGSNSQSVVQAIDAFFLSSTTGMNPNVNFGQLVRGPGKAHQIGTFTGILDMRGFVKVANGIQLMRSTKSPDWTAAREQALTNWMKTYTGWLQNSDIGKSTASKANNHLSFYVSQLAATKILIGDTKGAASVLQGYFSKQFQDQIAQSGEQPFEAARTRPFHYRCFNLEAMITNAKLGDQLGLNLWTTKSKYGATIQTALDYTMATGPKGEDISDIFPHVAAVAAAYGDPKGKYALFLQKNAASYKGQPFWFYDQSSALPNSPAGKTSKSKRADSGNDTVPAIRAQPAPPANTTAEDGTSAPGEISDAPTPLAAGGASVPPFECPAVFDTLPTVELEDGLFVTCDQLEKYYKIPVINDS